jgi:hypothetical protein
MEGLGTLIEHRITSLAAPESLQALRRGKAG